jgi:pyruvate dehydrogenase E1 component beta subunit
VAKTGRLLVVDEDFLSYGMSGEIIARTIEELGTTAVRQVRRHAMPDIPLPASIALETAAVPSADSIATVIRSMS